MVEVEDSGMRNNLKVTVIVVIVCYVIGLKTFSPARTEKEWREGMKTAAVFQMKGMAMRDAKSEFTKRIVGSKREMEETYINDIYNSFWKLENNMEVRMTSGD